jgi:hypothetical protein
MSPWAIKSPKSSSPRIIHLAFHEDNLLLFTVVDAFYTIFINVATAGNQFPLILCALVITNCEIFSLDENCYTCRVSKVFVLGRADDRALGNEL